VVELLLARDADPTTLRDDDGDGVQHCVDRAVKKDELSPPARAD
jgi:hypothetical protein